ncbi:serum response factor homolog [Drosophila ficusphila]|uniref:serum response factor homolog n=1 Tax=Drosophila ficusphila TaxID=30025 RepID=UPI0007E718A5|nr:serum response factor homolog [Drosophila ficusphila]
MDPTRGDSRYNLNYSMSSIGLSLTDPADMYGSPALGAGGRPPSGGLLQNMGGGVPPMQRPTGGAPPATQCQTLHSPQHASQQQQQQQQQQQHQQQQQQQQHPQQQQQQRGLKRSGSDCYEDHHRSSGGLTLQGLDNVATNAVDDSVDNYNPLPNKKSPPANGKKTKGRVKIKMEYIDNKLRRYTTFSKRKTGIMKKAYELSTLTGTQVMLLVASETGHVYTFATRKLQPMITSEAGKQLIQTCLNSPDPPSVGGGDQRMSATGFEETELSYNIADEDSKDDRSPTSSGNESDDSSDVEMPVEAAEAAAKLPASKTEAPPPPAASAAAAATSSAAASSSGSKAMPALNYQTENNGPSTSAGGAPADSKYVYPAASIANIPQKMLRQLIQSGHLQLHAEEDGNQYVTIPLSSTAANLIKSNKLSASGSGASGSGTATKSDPQAEKPLTIKQEYD